MAKSKGIANYAVRYNSNPELVTDNHKSDIIYLVDTDERCFDHLCDALKFLSECVSPITTVEELVPELKNCVKFKYLLRERNIKVKHQVTDKPENITNSQLDWN